MRKAEPGGPASIPVWDPLVRVFHWTLAVTVVVNYWLIDPGSDVHNWLGYVAAGAVGVRIVWGFVGHGYARFDSFKPSLAHFREHMKALSARSIPPDSGHNPLGALMIYLVFLLVAVLTITGWMHEEIDALFGNDLLQEIHEIAAHALWISAILHVVSVFFVQYVGRIDLVRPMITGRRTPRT